MHKSPGTIKRRDSDDPIDWLVQAAATGVGFVSEVYRYRQDKKAATRDAEATTATEDREAPAPDFVDTFNTSLVPNPYIFAINLAGFAGLAYPEPIMMLLDATLGLAVDAAMEAQSRFRSNTFLDRANAGFFRPRGLICLVVTYRPDAVGEGLITGVDFDGTP
ncbi:unnamed protein product [Parascedosporium putredinis]|uniref:Uncharacterized protein n=1 Tax=Parascedosporium putredinis TaxID=1442378 RepID=A0A9P1GX49_9PEZI|nr:unnamed protein product [Parascedosporium putredinis]CAI7990236.1 unnamed protein product [Parascedosporium putredinis]